jgi:hypothetical protein
LSNFLLIRWLLTFLSAAGNLFQSRSSHYSTFMKHVSLWILGLSLSATVCLAQFHTNVITTPGGAFNFTVDGVSGNPTLNLTVGVTNILEINTSSFHPVIVTTVPPPDSSNSGEYSGANPQNINSGKVTLDTPSTGFPTKLYYICSVHHFGGEIDLSSLIGPTPPRNMILEIKVGTNIVMTSTGTNTTWLLVPQFSSNLLSGVWSTVPNYTNTFANGTNTTVFNRLDPICGPNVFLRVSQQPH